ncbi:hypothetical protein [Bosea sp. ASV33]|uniref:hypothetical protein n=1 Tax=Bosea sp. ASV33 TaxID=2795106 RepID=UPI0018ED7C4B|nr:hypothetical protein [Bosea sp. ASV33]
MLGNIIDHRTDKLNPHVDVVYEPSIHDDRRRRSEPFFDWDETANSGTYFAVVWQYGTTLREAVLRAERDWPFPVTAYLYDRGSAPAG